MLCSKEKSWLSILCLHASLCAYEIPTRWEYPRYVWNFGLISQAHKGIIDNPQIFFAQDPIFDPSCYANMQAGDIAWLKCRFIPDFCKHILPSLNQPIILLIADGDESFPSECGDSESINQLLDNPYIAHILAQNNEYAGPSKKVTSIPIGIDFHTVAYRNATGGWGQIGSPKDQEQQLDATLATCKPTGERLKKVFTDFQYSDTLRGGYLYRYKKYGEDRTSIFRRLQSTGLIEWTSWMPRPLLWHVKGQYAFTVSPHGNGIDCHRTWEDLMLGCIVIVKTSPLDVLYEGLPVVIVNDWAEITEENLNAWLLRYGDASTNPAYREKLTNAYWFKKIKVLSDSLKKV